MTEPKPIIIRGRTALLKGEITQVLALRQLLRGKDVGHLYTTPVTTFQNQFEFHPQVTLYFNQSSSEANPVASTDPEDKKTGVTGEISYRIINENHETMTPGKALILAQKIKAKFAIPVCTWAKGVTSYTYWDEAKGYKFKLLTQSEGEARKLIEMTMDLQGFSPNWDLLRVHESRATYPVKPNKKLIYGQVRRPPRRRPIETAKFRYAEMHIHGIPHAITLVDLTGRRLNPLVTN